MIVGVVIGFQVTAWGQDRADRAREREYLRSLVADLRADSAQIRRAMDDAERRGRATRQLLAEIEGDARLSPLELAVAVEETMWFNFPAYTRTTVSELTSTGNLRLIRDAGLRRELSEYYQTIDRSGQWTGNWRRIQMDLEAVLPEVLDVRHRHAVTAHVNGVPVPPWADELDVSAEDATAIRQGLRGHPTYATRLKGMARIHGTLYAGLGRIRAEALDVLRTAEAALAQAEGGR
ncbi:hypothetical protein [Rubrivirga sp. IMCC45206]|uniref:hypothetical protein n=1 Tax=Rubrivirga sp. IMCC45206 TaxID=3391614 RepID=UPI00398FB962